MVEKSEDKAILYVVVIWINKDKEGEHTRMVEHFFTKREAESFISQVDNPDNYLIAEIDADEFAKVIEARKAMKK